MTKYHGLGIAMLVLGVLATYVLGNVCFWLGFKYAVTAYPDSVVQSGVAGGLVIVSAFTVGLVIGVPAIVVYGVVCAVAWLILWTLAKPLHYALWIPALVGTLLTSVIAAWLGYLLTFQNF